MLKSGRLGARRPLTAQSERTRRPIFPDISHGSAFFLSTALALIDFPWRGSSRDPSAQLSRFHLFTISFSLTVF